MYFDNKKLHYALSRFIVVIPLGAFACPLRDAHAVQLEFIFGGQTLFVMVRTQKMPLGFGGLSSCHHYDFDVAKVGIVFEPCKFFREKVSFRVQNFPGGMMPRARAYIN